MIRSIFASAGILLSFLSLKAQKITIPDRDEGRLIYHLDGEDWKVVDASPGQGEMEGFYKNAYPYERAVPAKVPGNIYWDLMRAGKLPDIFVGMNAKKTYDLPLREWWYRKSFTISKEWKNKRIRLKFAAIDYAAKIWLNGQYLGSHEGQFTPMWVDATGKINFDKRNELIVLIAPAPAGLIKAVFGGRRWVQDAYPAILRTLKYWKSHTMTGWDWGTRLWSMGIWQDVTLVGTGGLYLNKLLIYPDTHKPYKKATLKIRLDISHAVPENIVLAYKAECITAKAPTAYGSQSLRIEESRRLAEYSLAIQDPVLWWPNGYGTQNLYRLTVTAKDKNTGKIIDRISSRFGIRDLKILPNPDAGDYQKMRWYTPGSTGIIKDIPKDPSPRYLVEINGRPVFLHGGNWLPADLLFGRPARKEYEHLIRMASLANYNAFRVWGGGLIEKQVFYDLCDQYGILVDQEMPNGFGYPPDTPERLAITAKEQREVMPLLINHPSVFRYGFGNELYVDRETSLQEKQYEDIGKELDPSRPIYGADPVCKFQRHGPYRFNFPNVYTVLGRRALVTDSGNGTYWFNFPNGYTIYNTGHPLTIGADNPVEWTEYGVSGASSVETLKRIIPAAHLWPILSTDSFWSWHNGFGVFLSSDWLAPEIYRSLFGTLPDLITEVRASQFAQAEGLRYANQSQRRAKWHRSGCFMWTFNEPWPNAAHGSIIEYYGLSKMALYYTRNSYAQVDISIKYNSMVLHPSDTLQLPVFATNAKPGEIKGCLSTVVMDLKGKVYYKHNEKVLVNALSSPQISNLSFVVPKEANNNVLLARFDLLDNKGTTLSSETYTFGVENLPKDSIDRAYLYPMMDAPKAKLKLSVNYQHILKWGAEQMMLYSATVTNTSGVPALFVQLKSDHEPYEIYFKDNYFILLPGEKRTVDVLVSPQVKDNFRIKDINVNAWNL